MPALDEAFSFAKKAAPYLLTLYEIFDGDERAALQALRKLTAELRRKRDAELEAKFKRR